VPNEILRKASAFFAQAERPPTEVMVTFLDQHRDTYGVEPICAVLPNAPSTYYLRNVQQRDATKRSPQQRRDDGLRTAIQQVWDAHAR
jgi:putative transposase